MKAAVSRGKRPWALVLCLLASTPTPALALAPASSSAKGKKAPVRKGSFRTYFIAATRLYEKLEYERALEQLARAKELARGEEEDVRVALYEGIILADLGRREEAQAAMRTALYLQPDAKLPVKVSPKVEADFEELRAVVWRELTAAHAAQKQPKAPGPAEASAQPGKPASDAPVQPAREPGLTTWRQPPPPDPVLQPSAEEVGTRGSTPVLPLVLLGAGAVAGGAGGFFGLQAKGHIQDARAATFRDERAARLKDAEGEALLANVLFGAAGAAAVGALITYLASGDGDSEESPTLSASSEEETP
jgi:hypothetical protein